MGPKKGRKEGRREEGGGRVSFRVFPLSLFRLDTTPRKKIDQGTHELDPKFNPSNPAKSGCKFFCSSSQAFLLAISLSTAAFCFACNLANSDSLSFCSRAAASDREISSSSSVLAGVSSSESSLKGLESCETQNGKSAFARKEKRARKEGKEGVGWNDGAPYRRAATK